MSSEGIEAAKDGLRSQARMGVGSGRMAKA